MKKCLQCNTEFTRIRKDAIYCLPCAKWRDQQVKNRYSKSKAGSEARKRYDRTEKAKLHYRKYRLAHREKLRQDYYRIPLNVRKARHKLLASIRTGKLIRPKNCESCGRGDWGKGRSMIEGHHYLGYEPENWLKVRFLCVNCHDFEDEQERLTLGKPQASFIHEPGTSTRS